MKNSIIILPKVKYHLAITFLCMYPNNWKAENLNRYIPMFVTAHSQSLKGENNPKAHQQIHR